LFKFAFLSENQPTYQNNEYEIIKNNQTLLETVIKNIRKAKKLITINTYIFTDGIFMNELNKELYLKVKQGVKVYFMYDYIGSYSGLSKKYIKEMIANGINVSVFNKPGINIYKSATNFRGHKKAIIIDNQIAIYGSFNIADEYLKISRYTND
jgi:cardiolipin synthase